MTDFAAFANENIRVHAHSCVRIQGAAVNGAPRIMYVDPYLMDAEHGIPEAPHDADLVLFTHSHHDHLSPADAAAVARTDGSTRYVMPVSMLAEAVAAGIPQDAVFALAPGQAGYPLGVPVRAVPAYNARKAFHPKEKAWVGYVIGAQPNVTVYVCGDTDANPDCAAVDCSIICLPVGGKYTMNVPEAAALVNTMFAAKGKPAVAIPTHYGIVAGTPEDGEAFAGLVGEGVKVVVPY